MQHKFVEFIPDEIIEGNIYVSIQYGTAVHKCCCGCGEEVVTPFTPTDWKLIFDGETVSLSPSIGNWSFKCRSHYFIKKNKVQWCGTWSDEQVNSGKSQDIINKDKHFDIPVQDVKKSYIEKLWIKLKKLF